MPTTAIETIREHAHKWCREDTAAAVVNAIAEFVKEHGKEITWVELQERRHFITFKFMLGVVPSDPLADWNGALAAIGGIRREFMAAPQPSPSDDPTILNQTVIYKQ